MSKALTDEQCREAMRALAITGGNKRAAGRALGMPWPTFKMRTNIAQERFPAEYEIASTPRPVATLSDDAILHSSGKATREREHKYKEALARITELEALVKDLEWSAKGTFAPATWTLRDHKPKKREHTPYLLNSDAQIGEVIRAEETETGYGYDSKVYRTRYRKMIDTTIYLSFQHGGHGWHYPGIIYARGGDTISGGIHDELRDTDDLTPIQACECAFEEESAGITKLAEAFGKVDVKAPGAAGNHDRTTFKPRTKRADAHSYDRLIGYMLRHHFRNDKRVTFQVSESFDVRFPIYNQTILLTHGDRMGSAGGTGFVGPMATIMRGAQKVLMEQAALGYKIDRVDHGHFHTSGYNRWVLSNGSMPGYSEYAKSYRMRPEPPIQMLLFHHPRHGVVDIKPITLLEG